jgi:hypothetical protein
MGLSRAPIDTATGLQSGPPVHTGQVEVPVGYLITHPDGYEVRMPPDRTRAELYAAKQHATVEAMFVRRPA